MQNTKTLKKVTGLAPGKRHSSRRLTQLTLAALVASGVAFGGTAHAAVLAEYKFSGTLNSTDADTNSTASAFGFGAGIAANSGLTTQQYGAPDTTPPSSVYSRTAIVNGTPTTPGTAATAIAANSYFSFSISAAAGRTLSLTSLDFQTSTTGDAGTTIGNYQVRSSIDGFASSLGGQIGQVAVASGTKTAFTAAPTINFGSSFQNLSGTSLTPVEFRIYLYDNNNNANTAYALRADNVVLNGTTAAAVATPEPETWAMMGLGLAAVAFMGWKRRKNNAQQAPIAAGLAA